MVHGPVPPITSYNSANNTSIYSNPEYLRLMMMQTSSSNVSSIFGNSDENGYDPFGGSNNTISGDFYSELIKANTPTSISPQLEISAFGGLVGNTVTALYSGKNVKGKVESVALNNNIVFINIDGISYPSTDLIISKIE
ncbi:hypothetical protein ACFLZ2_03980 [Candidatus Margulisiibacteriota bacterium]